MTPGIMRYKGYSALIVYSPEDECLVGRLIGINDSVSFHGDSVEEMRRELKVSVDGYIDACAKFGKRPDKPASGKMLLRLPAELHSGLMKIAEATGQSANQLVVDILSAAHLGYFPLASEGNAKPAKATRRRGEPQLAEA